tara:strand:+ start:217 stop:558 length:342 start_codon:yes stop_codon:yes gene_type:complete
MKQNSINKTFYVYVIDLDKSVWVNEKKFRDNNPQYILGKPTVYVGQTYLTPKERFNQHKMGYKSNKYAKKYGRYIKQKNIPDKNPHTSRLEAENQEEEVAKILKKRGWAVWWN